MSSEPARSFTGNNKSLDRLNIQRRIKKQQQYSQFFSKKAKNKKQNKKNNHDQMESNKIEKNKLLAVHHKLKNVLDPSTWTKETPSCILSPVSWSIPNLATSSCHYGNASKNNT